MTIYIGWYLVVGFCWMLLMLKRNPAVDPLRKTIGEAKTMLVLAPVVVLWPVDLFALAVYFLKVSFLFVKWFVDDLWFKWKFRHAKTLDDLQQLGFLVGEVCDGNVEFGLVCSKCGADHIWLGSNEAMESLGWTGVRNPADSDDVVWFCEKCGGPDRGAA